MSITAISSSQGTIETEDSFLPSKLLHVAKIIAQMVIRVIFVLGSIVLTAAGLPVDWYSIGLPLAAVVSAFISSTFFQQTSSDPISFFASRPNIVLPKEFPRGLENSGMNCAFNSLFHFFKSSPEIAEWVQKPLSEDDALRQVDAEYRADPRSAPAPDALQTTIVQFRTDPQFDQAGLSLVLKDYLKKYNDILAVHQAYHEINAQYEKAIEQDLCTVSNSQTLRLALHQVNQQISPKDYHQQDAGECFASFLSVLPATDKLQCKVFRHYDLTPIPDAQRPDSHIRTENEIRPCLELAMQQKQKGAPLDLQQMLDYELDNDLVVDGMKIDAKDRSSVACQSNRTIVELQNAPKALYLQMKRYAQDQSAPDAIKKDDRELIVPDELTFQAAGVAQTYQLASFVHHFGFSPKRGHYTAGRILNEKQYLMSDEEVILADPASWQKSLQTAYLLCYVPKIAKDQSSARLPV